MKTYKDILKSKTELQKYEIENSMLKSIDLNVVAHFGNILTLRMKFINCSLFSDINMGSLLPYVLKAIIECLDLSEEDGININDIKDIPVRLVYENSRAVGFGHFMNDTFLCADNIIEIAKENLKQAGE